MFGCGFSHCLSSDQEGYFLVLLYGTFKKWWKSVLFYEMLSGIYWDTYMRFYTVKLSINIFWHVDWT